MSSRCPDTHHSGSMSSIGRTGNSHQRRRFLGLSIGLAILALVTVQAAEGLRIVPLVRDDNVLVTFQLTDGFTEQVKDAIHSGLKTTFTYNVELRLAVPAWVDRTVATSVVASSVEYDNLTRQA